MTGDESFLARWSRRKREAAKGKIYAHEAPHPRSSEESGDAAPPPTCPLDLPSLESIEAASDVRAFLAPGVPHTLTQAALRRAWTADPAIRDFIGLSENSWDFTAANGVPGFGPLDADQVKRLVETLFAEPEKTPLAAPPANPPEATQSQSGEPKATIAPPADDRPAMNLVQNQPGESTLSGSPRGPRHGGALPKI